MLNRFLKGEYAEELREILKKLASFHLHILETGELETILEEYGVTYKDKKQWIVEAIKKISELSKEDIAETSLLYQFISRIIHHT